MRVACPHCRVADSNWPYCVPTFGRKQGNLAEAIAYSFRWRDCRLTYCIAQILTPNKSSFECRNRAAANRTAICRGPRRDSYTSSDRQSSTAKQSAAAAPQSLEAMETAVVKMSFDVAGEIEQGN
jgi:hypothetical protein